MNALGLQRVLGLSSYQTAWAMLHRFRAAMMRPGRKRLHGKVEVDETYLAINDHQRPITAKGSKNNTAKKQHRQDAHRHCSGNAGAQRLRKNPATAHPRGLCVQRAPLRPAKYRAWRHRATDGSAVYRTLPDLGYVHQRTVMLGSDVAAHVSMPSVHRVAALLKRWILGSHDVEVQPAHLDAYLDEFLCRFNRRSSNSRGMLFYRLLQQAVVTSPVTYGDVVKKNTRAVDKIEVRLYCAYVQ